MNADMQRDSRAVELLNLLPDISHKTRAGERRRIVADVLAIHHPEHMFGKALEFVRLQGLTAEAQHDAARELERRAASLRAARSIDSRVRAAGMGSLWGLSKSSARHPRLIDTMFVDSIGSLCYLREGGKEQYEPETIARRSAHQWARLNRMCASYDNAVATIEQHCATLGMPPGMYTEVRDDLADPAVTARVWAVMAPKGITPPRKLQPRQPDDSLPVGKRHATAKVITLDSVINAQRGEMPTAQDVFDRRVKGADLHPFLEQQRLIVEAPPRQRHSARQRLTRWVRAVLGLGEFAQADHHLLDEDFIEAIVAHAPVSHAPRTDVVMPARPFSVFNLEP